MLGTALLIHYIHDSFIYFIAFFYINFFVNPLFQRQDWGKETLKFSPFHFTKEGYNFMNSQLHCTALFRTVIYNTYNTTRRLEDQYWNCMHNILIIPRLCFFPFIGSLTDDDTNYFTVSFLCS